MIELSQQGRLAQAQTSSPPHTGDDATSRVNPALNASFKKLIGIKVRFVAPVLGLSCVFILGTALLLGFDRPLMAEKIAGAFNIGYLLVVLMYCLSWAAAAWYVHVANRRFDAQAERAILEACTEAQS
ncbi:DUF485 domain-containing protein [Trinickia mobilis]|uniref:DUF485 domain-containing protein n=1 Tax=Trinickia mobilis TaxID=2816356 RepID=UPI001A8E9162|nr:DUF485 domain-containing protein [Trinickia mobilis]